MAPLSGATVLHHRNIRSNLRVVLRIEVPLLTRVVDRLGHRRALAADGARAALQEDDGRVDERHLNVEEAHLTRVDNQLDERQTEAVVGRAVVVALGKEGVLADVVALALELLALRAGPLDALRTGEPSPASPSSATQWWLGRTPRGCQYSDCKVYLMSIILDLVILAPVAVE